MLNETLSFALRLLSLGKTQTSWILLSLNETLSFALRFLSLGNIQTSLILLSLNETFLTGYRSSAPSCFSTEAMIFFMMFLSLLSLLSFLTFLTLLSLLIIFFSALLRGFPSARGIWLWCGGLWGILSLSSGRRACRRRGVLSCPRRG